MEVRDHPIQDGRPDVSADPFCLKCGEELTVTPEGWAAKSTGSTACAAGGRHSVEPPGQG
jgi:hypothetical protein